MIDNAESIFYDIFCRQTAIFSLHQHVCIAIHAAANSSKSVEVQTPASFLKSWSALQVDMVSNTSDDNGYSRFPPAII